MSRAIPQLRGFAERLIAHETAQNPYGAKSIPAFTVIEKMRPQLATLMGNSGFHGLLSRSLSLATVECAWLRAVHVNVNGALEGADEIALQPDQKEMADARVALLSQLLGLLVAFIGENLTVRLVREIWPEMGPDDFGSDEEGKNEKTK